MTDYAVVAAIAAALSTAAAMLGLGGAVLLIPAFLYLPPLLGAGALDLRTVSGMTSVQVLASSLLGVILHHRRGAVSRRIVLSMGIPIVVSSFTGAWLSKAVDPGWIAVAFALLAVVGAALLVLGREAAREYDPATDFHPLPAGATAFFVGFFGGMAGAPGAFILSPLMMTVLKIPTRVTIGSTLGIVLMAAASTSAGKFLAGQVRPDLAAAAIIGAIPGSFAGTVLSHRLDVRALRIILAALIAAVGVLMLLEQSGLI